MAILWRVRSLVCLLLAVSTAIGGISPARACGCGSPAKTPSSAPIEAHKPAAVARPTAKSCCQPTAKKRSCCSPNAACGTAAKASCCSNSAPTDRTERSSADTQPADAPGCHCLKCECDAPAAPAPAAPAPVAPDLDEYTAVSPVPTGLISEPPTAASRPVRSVTATPPTDLTISLSRLTC